MEKAAVWRVLRLDESNISTAVAFDNLWAKYGQGGYRRLSVRKSANQELWAFLFKGDQAKLHFEDPVTAVYAIAKPGGGSGGQAATRAIESFARGWFAAGERTSNFRIAESLEDTQTVLDTFEASRRLSHEDFVLSVAAAKVFGETPRALILKKCAPEFKQLRAEEQRQKKAQDAILREPCYCAVTEDGLHMPTDFLSVETWMGTTWSPDAPKRSMSFLRWLNSAEHLERTAVVFSDAGSGKTPALHATARSLAVRYYAPDSEHLSPHPYYLCSGSVNGLSKAFRKGLLRPGVPRIIEDYAPTGNPRAGRQRLEEYLVNLLNVKDGGAIDLPGGSQMHFPAGAPQLISTNRRLKDWIQSFKNFSIELQHAVAKRFVFFVLPDTPLVRSELRKRRQEDMTAAVMACIARERQFLMACGRCGNGLAVRRSEAGSFESTNSGPAAEADLTPTTAGSAHQEAWGTSGEEYGADGGDTMSDDATPALSPQGAPSGIPFEEVSAESDAHLSAAVSQLPAAAFGPPGPDGKPLFARLPEFVVVYLVFASDVLVRVGEVEVSVFEDYLAQLRALNSKLATTYVEASHCSVSFLTDTTTLKLMREWLADDGQISAASLYNIVIGQTVLPSWRKMEKLGPFDVESPPSAEAFAQRFGQAYPGTKAVVPKQLKQGVLGLLGKGPEITSCGRFIHDTAGKIPRVLERLRQGDECMTVLQEELGLPKFRALLVARLLSVADPTLYDMEQRDIGDFAELGLWLLLGLPTEQARAVVGKSPFTAGVDKIFLALVENLPSALAAVDQHGVVERLARLHLLPTSAQCVEHMLCEWRKMCLPEGRTARGEPFEDYKELWLAVAPTLARRAACERVAHTLFRETGHVRDE